MGVPDVLFALLFFQSMGWGSGDAGLEEVMWLAYPRGAAAAEGFYEHLSSILLLQAYAPMLDLNGFGSWLGSSSSAHKLYGVCLSWPKDTGGFRQMHNLVRRE
jgi:hypothetical protein